MKTLLTLLVGLILGAAGYWWLSLRTPAPVTAAPAPPAAPAAVV
ncbi:M23 family peptidase, partial [Xanthomonas sp. Kuri4-2]